MLKKLMSEIPKHIYLPFIPGKKIAVTVYPFIFWSRKKAGWKDPGIIIHEMYHWNEQKLWKETKRFGLMRWLIKYCAFWAWFIFFKRLKPKDHPMEKPAYEAQIQ